MQTTEPKIKEIITLPDEFESFGDARREGFLKIKELKDQGIPVAGVFCTYSPLEIFNAAGMVTVGLCASSDETIPEAEAHLPRNLCPLVKASYGYALTNKCPYMHFSDLVVGETTCDGKKKMYELLGELKNVHVMQLPNNQSAESRDQWYNEVLKLRDRVESDFGVKITEENLRDAIALKNQERLLMREVADLSIQDPPPISGVDQMKILYGTQFKFSFEQKFAELREAIDKIQADYDAGVRNVPAGAKRIVLTGCPSGGAPEKVVKVIEECGGVVVAFENCTGAKQYENLVDETHEDPYRAISDRYLDIGCSVMSPDTKRYELLEELTTRFKADAVIEMTLQACHTYNIETFNVKRKCESMGLPFISVETDYSQADIAQLKTRIGAFMEMIQ